MEKFSTIDELDSYIEKIVRSKVRHYYTDWKHIDRPKYMDFKGSDRSEDKRLVLIARECGTYLLPESAVENVGSEENTIYEYFRTQERTGTCFYDIDLNNLTLGIRREKC